MNKTENAGVKKVLRGIKSKNFKSEDKERMGKAQPFTFEGKQYYGFMDGHRIVACADAGDYEICDNPFKMEPMFSELKYRNDFREMFMTTVSKQELKDFIANNKEYEGKYGGIYQIDCGDDRVIGLNPKYVLDAMNFCETEDFWIMQNGFRKDGVYNQPIYFVNDEKQRLALVLPVNVASRKKVDDTEDQEQETKQKKKKEKKSTDDKKERKETMKKTAKKTEYFKGVKNLQELRSSYLSLLKLNHPDNGGSEEVTKEIINQYEKMFALLKSGAIIETDEDKRKWNEVDDAAIREALWKIIGIKGINIEVVGSWIWVDGETFKVHDELKAAGFEWSKARRKWHYTPYKSVKWCKGSRYDFDTLRRVHGSEIIENESKQEIAV